MLLAAAAYALLQELRWQARETEFARAQVPRLRDFLLKIAVRMKATVRRIVLHLPLGRSGWRSRATWELWDRP